MARILVVHSSHDGQTLRIAERVGKVLSSAGHEADLCAADDLDAGRRIGLADAVVVGAAIRYGHFSTRLQSLVRRYADILAARPNAFFSVCLTAGGPGAKPAVARGYVDALIERTGWHPAEIAIFAGALLYRRYNPVIRTIIRFIVGHAGGDTDTSRNYEYTDWDAVERFASRFASSLQASHAASPPTPA